jgi:hypothetical protein
MIRWKGCGRKINMIRRSLRALRLKILSAVFIATLTSVPCAFAEHGRDFSATYDLKDVSPAGADRVSVTLSLRLQNHSGADLADAEVSLEDKVPALRSLGVFPSHLSLVNHAVATLTGTFSVPTSYAAEWRTGHRPQVVVRYMSAQGHWIRRPVEMRFLPGVGR